uniref:Putative secreted protein n=1 Tax=Anopheles marajoara TaxID=58244 RepID=A0A2M4CD77_9DIPT
MLITISRTFCGEGFLRTLMRACVCVCVVDMVDGVCHRTRNVPEWYVRYATLCRSIQVSSSTRLLVESRLGSCCN